MRDASVVSVSGAYRSERLKIPPRWRYRGPLGEIRTIRKVRAAPPESMRGLRRRFRTGELSRPRRSGGKIQWAGLQMQEPGLVAVRSLAFRHVPDQIVSCRGTRTPMPESATTLHHPGQEPPRARRRRWIAVVILAITAVLVA